MFHDNQNPLDPEYTAVSSEPEGYYETGSIRPPKRHGGLVTAVLLFCIVCGTLVAVRVSRFSGEVTGPSLPSASLPVVDEAGAATQSIVPETLSEAELVISQSPELSDNTPLESGLSLREIYQKVSPSVVSVCASTSAGEIYGSGVIMSDSGYIITSFQIIDQATDVVVTLSDGSEYPGRVVGRDEVSDLAVLYIAADTLPAAEFGDSEKLQAGDTVFAIGYASSPELQSALTDGIISSVSQDLRIQGTELTLLQTTVALGSGNSGGPVINGYGQVVGINVAQVGQHYVTTSSDGLRFALSINTVKEVVDQLVKLGYVPGRPDLGLTLMELDELAQSLYGLPAGLCVTNVDAGTSADRKGVLPGDVILSVEDQRVMCLEDLSQILDGYAPGDEITIILYRSSQKEQLTGTITLVEAR